MTNEDYSQMIAKLDEIVNELKDHKCKHVHCCIKSLLEEIEFKE